MPDTPLNPDALDKAYAEFEWTGNFNRAIRAYLAVAQPEVNSFDPRELNRRGWTCGCEPGNYDSCDGCQSACNELAGFLNRPEVKP